MNRSIFTQTITTFWDIPNFAITLFWSNIDYFVQSHFNISCTFRGFCWLKDSFHFTHKSHHWSTLEMLLLSLHFPTFCASLKFKERACTEVYVEWWISCCKSKNSEHQSHNYLQEVPENTMETNRLWYFHS